MAQALRNRRWILKRRPVGIPVPEDFELVEELIDAFALPPGHVLVRNLVTICAPDQRNWMNEQINFHPPMALGETVASPNISRIEASTHPDYAPGMVAFTLGGWSDYAVLDIASLYVPLVPYPEGTDPIEAIAVLGMNQLAAYFGLLKVGEPKPGDLLVVSGAAGSAGSTAAQIGKIKGCTVVGIAGGTEKCAWLREECGLDDVIDYKAQDVAAVLAERYHNRIDIFFDNVGGEILQAAFDNMAPRGRIALCGMIAGYSGDGDMEGPGNFMRIVHGAIRMQGFVAHDWVAEFPAALGEMKGWMDAGLLRHREDIRSGLENLPHIYPDLFRGGNTGTLVVRLADN